MGNNIPSRRLRIVGSRSLAALIVLSGVSWVSFSGSASEAAQPSSPIVSMKAAAAAAGKPTKGQYPPQMVVKGQTGFAGEFLETIIFNAADGRHSVRIWESGPGVLQTDGYPYDEYCIVLEGTLEITNRSGGSATYGPGDTFVIPKGWQGVWNMKTRFRKQYAVLTALDATAAD